MYRNTQIHMMLYVYNTISITLTVLFVQFTYFYKFQVESAIVSKVMSTGVNIKPSEVRGASSFT